MAMLPVNTYVTEMATPVKQIQTQAPAVEPLELAEVKEHLYITHDEDDTMITRMIVSARRACESFTGRSLITQKWALYWNNYPVGTALRLRHGPVQSIESVISHASDGNAVPFDPTKYYLSDENLNGTMVLGYGEIFPTNTLQYRDGVEVNIVTGFGPAKADIPMELIEGMLQYIAVLYEDREMNTLPDGVKEKWQYYRLIELN